LHLAREELAVNEEDVGQAPRLEDVAKCLPCLRGSLAPLDVVKLTIHQVGILVVQNRLKGMELGG
jgi:hypothetical protein